MLLLILHFTNSFVLDPIDMNKLFTVAAPNKLSVSQEISHKLGKDEEGEKKEEDVKKEGEHKENKEGKQQDNKDQHKDEEHNQNKEEEHKENKEDKQQGNKDQHKDDKEEQPNDKKNEQEHSDSNGNNVTVLDISIAQNPQNLIRASITAYDKLPQSTHKITTVLTTVESEQDAKHAIEEILKVSESEYHKEIINPSISKEDVINGNSNTLKNNNKNNILDVFEEDDHKRIAEKDSKSSSLFDIFNSKQNEKGFWTTLPTNHGLEKAFVRIKTITVVESVTKLTDALSTTTTNNIWNIFGFGDEKNASSVVMHTPEYTVIESASISNTSSSSVSDNSDTILTTIQSTADHTSSITDSSSALDTSLINDSTSKLDTSLIYDSTSTLVTTIINESTSTLNTSFTNDSTSTLVTTIINDSTSTLNTSFTNDSTSILDDSILSTKTQNNIFNIFNNNTTSLSSAFQEAYLSSNKENTSLNIQSIQNLNTKLLNDISTMSQYQSEKNSRISVVNSILSSVQSDNSDLQTKFNNHDFNQCENNQIKDLLDMLSENSNELKKLKSLLEKLSTEDKEKSLKMKLSEWFDDLKRTDDLLQNKMVAAKSVSKQDFHDDKTQNNNLKNANLIENLPANSLTNESADYEKIKKEITNVHEEFNVTIKDLAEKINNDKNNTLSITNQTSQKECMEESIENARKLISQLLKSIAEANDEIFEAKKEQIEQVVDQMSQTITTTTEQSRLNAIASVFREYIPGLSNTSSSSISETIASDNTATSSVLEENFNVASSSVLNTSTLSVLNTSSLSVLNENPNVSLTKMSIQTLENTIQEPTSTILLSEILSTMERNSEDLTTKALQLSTKDILQSYFFGNIPKNTISSTIIAESSTKKEGSLKDLLKMINNLPTATSSIHETTKESSANQVYIEGDFKAKGNKMFRFSGYVEPKIEQTSACAS